MSKISMVKEVIEAALDQPKPTPELRAALNRLLAHMKHPLRDQSTERAALAA